MKAFLKALAHAALGGGAVAAAQLTSGTPITLKGTLLPVLASAVTSVVSLLAQSPLV